jgi:hypothetical protein
LRDVDQYHASDDSARSRISAAGGDAEVGGSGVSGCPAASFDLDKFVFGAGEADLESLDLAEPPFAFGFGDAGLEVVSDLLKP